MVVMLIIYSLSGGMYIEYSKIGSVDSRIATCEKIAEAINTRPRLHAECIVEKMD